ncbi:metallophosphoesterase family protein [Sphingobacterium spiritivorum]|uniref:metallophosphoesterase family protein n=1 Tax=Sphingobacterium spiritivorum TaxID=258 RepID=UPI001917DB1A|nr:metallophosphoesterase [Sphingobacterium spiritivorum]QQT26362.1 metallophosphoesterase [Sphingobacterium spiritivorum]
MIRLAIISDIHGNLPALQSVLEDIRIKDIGQIYCLGDLVDFAPWGNEVIDQIKSRGIPCLLGNHDERIAFDQEIRPLPHHSEEETAVRYLAINHSKATITTAHKQFLAQFPYQLRLTYKIGMKQWNIQLVHASTRSNDEYVYEDHDKADLIKMLSNSDADLLAMGHTHLSYQRKVSLPSGKVSTALNCGSVGRSKEKDRKATYAVITLTEESVKADIIKVDYPIAEVAEAIAESSIPDFYADFLLKST